MAKWGISFVFVLLAMLVATPEPMASSDSLSSVRIETETLTLDSSTGLFRTYEIAGNPTRIAIENPGRVWVTLPDIDAIGVISSTGLVSQTVESYTVRTYVFAEGTHPYDLDVDGDKVWFSAYGTNQIIWLDPSTGHFESYPLPDDDSGPTGIQVANDGVVWFAEQKANRLGKFDPVLSEFRTYPYTRADAGLDSIATLSPDSIWITAPNVNRLVYFDSAVESFISIPTLPYTRPTGIALESADTPWVSVSSNNLIGRYAAGTLTFWRWTPLPGDASTTLGADRIAISANSGERTLFYVDADSPRVGMAVIDANTSVRTIRQAGISGDTCLPKDIDISSDGNGWFTCSERDKVIQWIYPFFYESYAPIIAK